MLPYQRRPSRGVPSEVRAVTKGRIRQTAVSWCYEPMDVETLARHAASIGLVAFENVSPKDWPILKRYGLVNAMTVAHGFVDGLNHRENHAMCIAKLTESIEASGDAGFPNVITFSGMRRGMPDDIGLDNTVHALKQVIGLAERKKVNLCLEVLNSRVNVTMKGHPDYMCDKVEWAAEVCKRLGSEHMKILFDIYHVQIMQGDVISRIRQFHAYIGHYHLAGVPGRGEMDVRRNSTTRPSCAPFFTPATRAMLARNSFQHGIRSGRFASRRGCATSDPLKARNNGRFAAR